jgi:hypothetical protein
MLGGQLRRDSKLSVWSFDAYVLIENLFVILELLLFNMCALGCYSVRSWYLGTSTV